MFISNKLKEKQNKFTKQIRDVCNNDIRRLICISIGLVLLICEISLQFCCDFIKKNRSNIFLVRNILRWVKFPISILCIIYSMLNLYNLVKDRMESSYANKKELMKIIGKLASLTSRTIEAFIMLKALHNFLIIRNIIDSTIAHARLISTVLSLFISEPINYYCMYEKYNTAYKMYQDACISYKYNKDKNYEFKKCKDEFIKCKKNFITSTLILSLGFLNFMLRRIEITTKPINLGHGIVYNYNFSVIVSIMYSTLFLFIQFDKLFSRSIDNNDIPSTKVDSVNYSISKNNNHDVNGFLVSSNNRVYL